MNDTRPLLFVTSVLKHTHSPDGGWVIMWRSTWTGVEKQKEMSTSYTGTTETSLRVQESSPSPRPEWPCPEGRTWSGRSPAAGCPQWTQHHSPGGWQWRSVAGEKETRLRKCGFCVWTIPQVFMVLFSICIQERGLSVWEQNFMTEHQLLLLLSAPGFLSSVLGYF